MGIIFRNSKGEEFSFSDFWKKPKDKDLSKQEYTIRPAGRKLDGGLATNDVLLKGIYTGSAQNFALSSYLSGGMIDVPKNMTGVPGIIPDEGQDDRLIKELNALIVDEYPVLVATMLIQGTAWRWARWSDKLRKLVWEAIPDSSITSLIIDLDTGEIAEIWTDEQIEYNKGEIAKANTTRKRHITRELVTEDWKGEINKCVQYKNHFGFMPVPFGHNCYEGDWRGNSVFARVLRLLKESHDIAYKRGEILSEFEPKVVQNVKDPKTWQHNNTTKTEKETKEIDIFSHRMLLNQDSDTTTFLFLPGDATSQHTATLQDNELKIIKGSGVPELFFGALATGNHASTDADKLLVLDYIGSLRRELTKGTQELVNQSLAILAYMRFTQPPRVSIQWGNLSMMSETEKAQVMSTYASAIVPLLGNGAISKEGAFYLTKELYPEFPVESADHFMAGLDAMITEHASKIGQPAFDTGGMF